ncbi:hypothetical protein BOTBODRAFT_354837 [Botryobasidium botryosum FD-172 SS1]|uniref:Beta-lactamase-related domain-containing protein n=1 Tax=Botryobasidium botryosum (strain FD-172 SS1) TaxID=930990 RepID=A0A067MQR7_BOTB1|nr:hypothetical protein BOTBODRAFT_354837 [Botryobasidium botryosum FD-172 SS1]
MAVSVPELDNLLESYTKRPDGIAGLAAIAIDRNGNIIYSGTFGATSVDPSKASPVTLDTVHWIASQTKLLTTIAAMQCVERGQIGLDDPVGEILPELADPDIVEGFDDDEKPKLRKAATKITLKLLLTHTSGLAYNGIHPTLNKWCKITGMNLKPSEAGMKAFTFPLVFEPGTSWTYGAGIEWAGLLVERLNSCTLEEYMQKNIFVPLGMNSTTFHPEAYPKIESRLVDLTKRLPDGTLASMGRFYPYPATHDFGGAGLYSTAADFIKLLATLLRGGGAILKIESVDAIFRPQVTTEAGEAHSKWMREEHSAPSETTFGLSASIAVAPFPNRRAAGTAKWNGMPNLDSFVDRETGIAATIFQQTFPPDDPVSIEFAVKFEELLYSHVRASPPPS